MAKLLKLRRGSTSAHASFTGAEGEVTIDTTKDTAVVHDGSQAGGRPLAREDMSNVSSASIAGQLGTDSIAVGKIAGGTLPSDVKVTDSNVSGNLTIVNADVTSSAAIAGTKISPDFGSQNITTTGNANISGDVTLGGTRPRLNFYDSSDNPDLAFIQDGGMFQVFDQTNGANRVQINSDGHVDVLNHLDVNNGLDVTGNISVSGTVDGRDVAADGTKLDGIESGSTGDQTAAEIRTLVESASDSNVFTDADHSKLNGIESGATADQTKSDIDGLNINADQVDGLHASSFIRSDTADTASGDITFNGGGGAVMINNGSDIRLQSDGSNWTGDYGAKLQHHSNYLYIQGGSSGHIFRNPSGSNIASLDTSGNFVAQGNVTAYSDARLKTDISTINDALGICGKLRGVSYKWIEDGSAGIGVIAQEVEEVLPELVLTNQDVNPVTQEIEEIKSVDYGKIVGVLINAINELKAEVDELKGGK